MLRIEISHLLNCSPSSYCIAQIFVVLRSYKSSYSVILLIGLAVVGHINVIGAGSGDSAASDKGACIASGAHAIVIHQMDHEAATDDAVSAPQGRVRVSVVIRRRFDAVNWHQLLEVASVADEGVIETVGNTLRVPMAAHRVARVSC